MKKLIYNLMIFLLSQFMLNIYFSPLTAQTYFSENFESGLSNWIVGGNNWDTLSTTYTSSNHCVTDSRVGNYTYNSDPTITMSQTINLTSSTVPMLTFFHRYNLVGAGCGGAGDSIYVQISTNAGFNWTTLKSWKNTNNAWSYIDPIIDLTNYRSSLVKIRFQLSAHNACGQVADGWYIDDIKIIENTSLNPLFEMPFVDNFENGVGKWIVGGFNWDTLSTTYTSTNHCLTDSRVGNYTYNSNPTFTMLGVVNLSTTTLPVLTFFHRYNLVGAGCGGAGDSIYVQISTNAGFNWTTLKSWKNTNHAWTYIDPIDLSNYRFNSVKFRFQLSVHNACGQVADGWYIDDIKITENSALNQLFSLPYTDNFENGVGKWIIGGFNWDTLSTTYNSFNHCLTDSRVGNYTYNSNPTFTMSGVINLSNTILPALTFFHRYNLVGPGCGGAGDSIYVQISTNAGFNWTTIKHWTLTNNTWTYVDPIDLTNFRSSLVKIRFQLSVHNACGQVADGWYIDDVLIRDLSTGVTEIENFVPDKFSMKQNYPNPFNPTTNIEFSIPKQLKVKITVYDSRGKEISSLLDQSLSAGTHKVDFHGANFSSGIYFYKIEAESFIQTKSMVLLK